MHLSAGLGVCICPPLPTRLAAVSLTHSLSFSGAVCAGEFRGGGWTQVLSSAPGLLLLGAWRGWPPGGRPCAWATAVFGVFCPDWLVLWVASCLGLRRLSSPSVAVAAVAFSAASVWARVKQGGWFESLFLWTLIAAARCLLSTPCGRPLRWVVVAFPCTVPRAWGCAFALNCRRGWRLSLSPLTLFFRCRLRW